VSFVGRIAAPSIEGLLERHSGFELIEIVGVHARKIQRSGEQPSRL
jgi:hypothetical protein